MSDERDGSDAAADGGETGDTVERGGRTAVATRPQRPTGKRSRQRAAADTEAAAAAEDQTTDSTDSSDTETKKTKKARKGKKTKKSAGAVNPFAYVYNYLKQVVAELRKVIWPNRKQMITYTSVVLAFLVFMVALIGGADYGFAKLIMLVFGE
ncbi:preprotein translocase subunit SecE [Mycobacterium eburneum]|nr:preprotein translocase subunit SecE [Mycobacterium eburneum]TDH50753.1 preprotein translocase subunit SecE [Mycobacterium eburneum]